MLGGEADFRSLEGSAEPASFLTSSWEEKTWSDPPKKIVI